MSFLSGHCLLTSHTLEWQEEGKRALSGVFYKEDDLIMDYYCPQVPPLLTTFIVRANISTQQHRYSATTTYEGHQTEHKEF